MKRSRREFTEKKVISYCLYSSPKAVWTPDSVYNFHRYVTGLSKNLELRDKLFPEWEVYLYLSDDLVDDCEITEILSKHDRVTVLPITRDYAYLNYRAFERYRVLWDHTVDKCIIRDIDQLLTPEDARNVQQWEDSPEKLLLYKWEGMLFSAMGGGFGAKNIVRYLPKMSYDQYVHQCGNFAIDSSGRGFDEYCLTLLLNSLNIPLKLRRVVITSFERREWRSRDTNNIIIRGNSYMTRKPYSISYCPQIIEDELSNCGFITPESLTHEEYLFAIATIRSHKTSVR